jgi:hypothetical protein
LKDDLPDILYRSDYKQTDQIRYTLSLKQGIKRQSLCNHL